MQSEFPAAVHWATCRSEMAAIDPQRTPMATVPTAKLRIVSLRPRRQATTNTGDAITATSDVMMTVVVMTVSTTPSLVADNRCCSMFPYVLFRKTRLWTGRSTQNEHRALPNLAAVRAAAITAYEQPLVVAEYPDPVAPPSGVVLEVEASGICLSDWHAWKGHEDLPSLPHVPGHEMTGVVREVGSQVDRWRGGERVTVPFSVGCGLCSSCRAGHLNICDRGFTPGFSHWGSFAELVAIDHADLNLVALPDTITSVNGAALGCRFVTAFRAVVDRGGISEGDWLAVYGCGGVGLSAVMIGRALGARVVAIDLDPASLALASDLGAEATVEGSTDPARVVREITEGGASVSIDAAGVTATFLSSVDSVRKQGRHVQVGLLHGEHSAPALPMQPVIMGEVAILGSRGLPATDYPRVFRFIEDHGIDLSRLVTGTVALEDASGVLEHMGEFKGVGVTVIDRL